MRIFFLLGLAQLTTANVLPRQSATVEVGRSALTGNPDNLEEACSIVAEAAASAKTFPPSLALDCLQSIPVEVDADLELLDQLTLQVETLSTLDYLKAPPAGYLIPGVDIMGAFDEMRRKLKDRKYANQYHFFEELVGVYQAASEGHFSWRPNLLWPFELKRSADLRLVTISKDGLELPKVYTQRDLVKGRRENYDPSEIASIDGVPIQDLLAREAFFTTAQDPDAKYNMLMESSGVHDSAGQFYLPSRRAAGLPDSHNVTFANSSTVVFRNTATLRGLPTGIESTADLIRFYLLPSSSSSSASKALVLSASHSQQPSFAEALRRAERNPTSEEHGSLSRRSIRARDSFLPHELGPFVSHKMGMMHGYLLDRDACVLAVPSFSGNGTDDTVLDELNEMERVLRAFVATCKAQRRDKLVLDLSGNGGGTYVAGVVLFRFLAPAAEYKQAYSFRASPFMRYLAANMNDQERRNFYTQPPSEFKPSFAEYLQPTPDVKQGPVTSHVVIDPFRPGTSDSSPSPPFNPDNMIVVTDGLPASTAAGVVGLLSREAGVRVVAFGGRPQEGPMQGAGRTRGGFVYSEEMFHNLSSNWGSRPDPPRGVAKLPTWPMAVQGYSDWKTNWNNEFAVGAARDAVPLQFSYEAAHCRRFYTAENFMDQKTVWADAAAVAWKGAKCVRGSTVNGDGTIGKGGLDGAPGYSDSLRSNQRYVGVGAVNDGVAASGQLPPQGNRKAGTSPGGGNGGGDSGYKDEKKDAADGLRVSGLLIAAVAILVTGAVVL
ncbi:hypothetical protein PspLS_11298 [Pyricularia sp. CBS 133598]|nr:hypothetical protein PspLS_11298 [Pyricularia sp. CBS 133598]